MVTPAARREAVAHLQVAYEVSERRACSTLEAKHGRYTKEVAATRRWLREATSMLRDLNKCPDDNRNNRKIYDLHKVGN